MVATLRLLLTNVLILVLLAFTCVGQEKEADNDSVTVKDFIPTGVRIGTDALALIKTAYDERYSGWELNAEVDFHRYFLAVDMGNWQRDLSSDQGRYTNKGTYFRIGPDVNFLHREADKNVLFFGARYARSVFSEDFFTTIDDPVWGTTEGTFSNSDAKARWFELTGGLRVRVWKIVWLGYTARFKFGLGTSDTPAMLPYDIPGYGRNDKKSTWGFNYLIMVRLPLRSDKGIR
jgi:hypothetical protein